MKIPQILTLIRLFLNGIFLKKRQTGDGMI